MSRSPLIWEPRLLTPGVVKNLPRGWFLWHGIVIRAQCRRLCARCLLLLDSNGVFSISKIQIYARFANMTHHHLLRLPEFDHQHKHRRAKKKKRGPRKAIYKIYKFARGINAAKTTRRTIFAKDEWVFELDEDEYKGPSSMGYGPCAGKIIDPHVKPGPYVEWADGNSPGPVKRKHLVKAPSPGETVVFLESKYTVVAYTDEGVQLQMVNEAQPAKKRTRQSGASGMRWDIV